MQRDLFAVTSEEGLEADTHQLLVATRQLLATGWTQRRYARNANGLPVDHLSKDACKWCVTGALHRASVDLFSTYEWILFHATMAIRKHAIGVSQAGIDLADWNDEPSRTQVDVLKTVDRAIKATKEKTQ